MVIIKETLQKVSQITLSFDALFGDFVLACIEIYKHRFTEIYRLFWWVIKDFLYKFRFTEIYKQRFTRIYRFTRDLQTQIYRTF